MDGEGGFLRERESKRGAQRRSGEERVGKGPAPLTLTNAILCDSLLYLQQKAPSQHHSASLPIARCATSQHELTKL